VGKGEEGEDKMKKLIMLVMVLGLFMVGTARADGAWVLWEGFGTRNVTYSNGKIMYSNGFHFSWSIIQGYPDYEMCVEGKNNRISMWTNSSHEGFEPKIREWGVVFKEISSNQLTQAIIFNGLPRTVGRRK